MLRRACVRQGDLLEPYDAVLADRGFPIREELTMKRATLLIPPGRNGVNQMTSSDVHLTKAIANRRIYTEQAIRRMKCFRILKYEVPLSLSCTILMTLSKLLLAFVTCTLHFLVIKSKTKIILWKIYSM